MSIAEKLFKKGIAWILAVAIVVTFTPMIAFNAHAVSGGNAAESKELLGVGSDREVTGGSTITEEGTYQLKNTTDGVITVDGGINVTIEGDGQTNYSGIQINCSEGANITLKNLTIKRTSAGYIVMFTGSGNKLTIDGKVIFENNSAGFSDSSFAPISVSDGTSLEVKGSGTLYVFKKGGCAAIGGSHSGKCGSITFNMTGSLFAYGSQTGATIGSGQATDCENPITFESGTYYLASNARGAIIGGGGMQSSTVGKCSSNITVEKEASLSCSVDFTGGIGSGGGQSDTSHTIASAGKFIVKGGSVRTHINSNAKSFQWDVVDECNSPNVIGLEKKDNNGEALYMLECDVSGIEGSSYEVKVDNVDFYKGGKHQYAYKETEGNTTEQFPEGWTDWKEISDNSLYFYVTGRDHILNINGTEVVAKWNEESKSFDTHTHIYGNNGFCSCGKLNPDARTYAVSTEAQLKAVAVTVNSGNNLAGKTVKLKKSIVLEKDWTPIGNETNAFAGTFDGNNKTISKVNVDSTEGYAGFFGKTSEEATIKDLTVNGDVKSSAQNGDYIGGVVAYNMGKIEGVTANVNINSGNCYNVGGIVGFNDGGYNANISSSKTDGKGIIENSICSASVTGYQKVGGIAGENSGTIKQSCATGKIDGTNSSNKNGVGGIAGRNGNNNTALEEGVVDSCYFVGTVGRSGQKWVGGITGFNNSKSSIKNCYMAGELVQGFDTYNRIAGNNEGGSTTTNNYALASIIKGSGTKEIETGIEKTAEELESDDIITSLNGESGTAFVKDTSNINNGYPVLSFQVKEGWSGEIDTSWYDPEEEEFEISSAEELAGLVALVNGEKTVSSQEEGQAKSAQEVKKVDFEGQTIELDRDIVLDAAGKYTENKNVSFGSSDYPMKSSQYTVNNDAVLWTPIGNNPKATSNTPDTTYVFKGTFDGHGHTISGLYTAGSYGGENAGNSVQGLFGCVEGATIKNITVEGCVTAKVLAGGIVAYAKDSVIENCTNKAIVYADGGTTPGAGKEDGLKYGGAVGGIAGRVAGTSTVTGCENNQSIVCTNTCKGGRTGGIVGLIDGDNDQVAVAKCGNKGDVDTYQYGGGIVGFNNGTKSPISECYNTGKVTGHSTGSAYIGGIVSKCYSNITECYNTGTFAIMIDGSGDKGAHFGGIVSDFYGTEVKNCYNTGTSEVKAGHSQSSVGGICGTGYGTASDNKLVNCYSLKGTGYENTENKVIEERSDTELQKASMHRTLGEKFSFDVEKTINNGYPVFKWMLTEEQLKKAEAAVDAEVTSVENMINEISIIDLSGESKDKIDDAREAYNYLCSTDRKKVKNYATLTEAEAQYNKLKNVYDLIDAIPSEITSTAQDAIEKAREAYDRLDTAERKLITNYSVLTEAEKAFEALEDKDPIKAVEGLIKKIDSEITLNSGEGISAAREAYDNLDDAQQDAVRNYSTLVAAEEELAALSGAYDAIGELPAASEVSAKNKDEIEAARAAYDSLTAAQKKQISNYSRLEKAEKALDEYLEKNTPGTPKLTGEASGSTAAVLTWTVEESKPTATSYEIYRVDLNGVTKLGSTEASVLTYTDSTVKAGTTYGYYVKACSDLGSGNIVYAESEVVYVSIEQQQSGSTPTPSTNTEADIVTGIIGNIGSTIDLDSSYEISVARKAYDALTAEQKKQVTNYSTLTAAEKALEEYKAKYVPAAVCPIAASAGYDSVTISWAKADNATGYEVYRSTSLNGNYELIKTVDGTSFTDSSLETGKTYYYSIKAYSVDNNGKKVTTDSAKISATPALGKTSTVKTKAGKKKAAISWSKVSGAEGYKIYRSVKKSSGYKCVKTAKANSTSFTNKSLKSGKTYYYKVRAYRTVNGEKTYGSYSSVRSVKAK